ncbi:hypothetical protein ACKYVA_21980, partial [Paenibacillus larvae]|uniref:hypothetical protein n=1 Tax=Paenibacillus larvae TaxID=1464 RepID=UPI0039082F1B
GRSAVQRTRCIVETKTRGATNKQGNPAMQPPTWAQETPDRSTEALGSFHGSPEPRAPPSALQAALA